MLGLPALLLLFALGQDAVSATDLSVVRGHYVSAAYEEALSHLARLPPEAVTPELEQYRAFCLLALGRPDDGQAAFERLVRMAPLYRIPEGDVSPRIRAVFLDVRRQVLPAVVRDQYAIAQVAFTEKRYATAAAEFKDILLMLGDVDAATDAAAFADLRQLTDGFLRLSEAEMALAARAEALAAAPPPAPAPEPAPPVAQNDVRVTKIVVYSPDDPDVVPPVERERLMPPWNPPTAMARLREYRGELEVIVNEAGRVEAAVMRRSALPSYDVALTDATERWRFEPALRDGIPVKFRLTFAVVLSPAPR